MTKVTAFAQNAQKFLAAASAAVALIIANGLIDGTAATWATTVIAAVGAALVYLVPNKAADGGRLVSENDVTDAVQAEKTRVQANSVPVADVVAEPAPLVAALSDGEAVVTPQSLNGPSSDAV